MKRANFKSLTAGQLLVAGPKCLSCFTAGNKYVTQPDVTGCFHVQCNEGMHEFWCEESFEDGDFRTVHLTPFEQLVQSYIDQELAC